MVDDANEFVPKVVVMAGANGSGKSTSAEQLLRGALDVDEFVNADVIAKGLSGFAPDRVAIAAGRIMLERLHELARRRVRFGFETTLASRSFAPWLARLIDDGYEMHIVFLWLRSAEMAIARVAERVRQGGHHVPEAVIRRRYRGGARNFFALYQPLAATWQLVDNSDRREQRLVAAGSGTTVDEVFDAANWDRFREVAGI